VLLSLVSLQRRLLEFGVTAYFLRRQVPWSYHLHLHCLRLPRHICRLCDALTTMIVLIQIFAGLLSESGWFIIISQRWIRCARFQTLYRSDVNVHFEALAGSLSEVTGCRVSGSDSLYADVVSIA